MHKVKCGCCGDEFYTTWTDEEAMQEANANFGKLTHAPQKLVCDSCYRKFMEWYKQNCKDQ